MNEIVYQKGYEEYKAELGAELASASDWEVFPFGSIIISHTRKNASRNKYEFVTTF